MVRDVSYFNEYFYQQDLKKLKTLNIVKHKTDNETPNAFQERLLEKINKNVLSKTLQKREKTKRKKPWITKVKLQSMKLRITFTTNR